MADSATWETGLFLKWLITEQHVEKGEGVESPGDSTPQNSEQHVEKGWGWSRQVTPPPQNSEQHAEKGRGWSRQVTPPPQNAEQHVEKGEGVECSHVCSIFVSKMK